MDLTKDDGEWCTIEIMGHLEHFGRAKEVPMLGGFGMRVCARDLSAPIVYGIGAIFSVLWHSEDVGESIARDIDEAAAQMKAASDEHDRIVAIAERIKKIVGLDKLPIGTIRGSVADMADDDFEAAMGETGLSLIPGATSGGDLYWNDPDDTPW